VKVSTISFVHKIQPILTVILFTANLPVFSAAQQAKIDSVERALPLLKNNSDIIHSFAELADAYTFVNAESSITYGKRALSEAIANNNPLVQILAHQALGRTYQTKAQSQLMSYHLMRALQLCDSMNNKPLKIKSLELLAVSKENTQPELAMRYLLQALAISEELHDKEGTAAILHRIGTQYFNQGKYQEALSHYIRSKELWDEISPLSSAGINSEIGNVYYRLKDYRSALSYYERALAINRQIGDMQGLGYSYNNVGLALYRLNEHTKALEALEQALKYRLAVNSKEGISNSYVNLAMYYLSEGDYDRALAYAKKNLDYVQTSGFLNLTADAYNVMAQVRTERKEYKQAYANFVRFIELRDSINSAQQQKNLSELQVLYETQQKEAENARLRENQTQQRAVIQRQATLIIFGAILVFAMAAAGFALYRANKIQTRANLLLQKQNEIIERQKRQVEEINAVKDRLFSVLTHDLRAPITSLKTFITTLDDPSFTEQEMREYSRLAASSIDSIAELIENVLHWSKSQWKGIISQPANINLHSIVKDRIRLLMPQAQEKNITMHNLIPSDVYAYADYQMIDIVLRNLLSNAIKFTHQNGTVRVRVAEKDDGVNVSIEDTGIGIEKERLNQLFTTEPVSTFGTEGEHGTGLGLVLCKEFIEKNGGTIWIESEPKHGTIVTFSLPCAQQTFQNKHSQV
jgi:two-component system sensor histidine kinase/response regulator